MAADPAAGQAVAQRWCATCHLVNGAATSGQSDAPSFRAIAAREADITPAWLTARLLGPHPQMGVVSLSRAEAADLAAYLATLRN